MTREEKNKIISYIVFSISIFFIGMIGYVFLANIFNFLKNDDKGEIQTISDISESNVVLVKNDNQTTNNNVDYSGFNSLNNSTSSTNYSKTENIDKYFYNQLDDYAKIIYKELYENKENTKTGTYSITFDKEFQDLLEQDGGSDKLQKYYQDAVDAFFFDNTDVFWIDVNKLYINIDTQTKIFKKTYTVYLNQGNNSNYFAAGFNSKSDVDKAVASVEKVRDSIKNTFVGTNYEKVLKIHDYLVESIEYKDNNDNIHNIYGALVTKQCVCEGYAKAFKYLADTAGVESVIVKGIGTSSDGESEKHAWDVVKIANDWYVVDSTWDDPVVIGGGTASSTSKYKYFLKGSNTINKDHTQSGFIVDGGKEFLYPVPSINDYQ